MSYSAPARLWRFVTTALRIVCCLLVAGPCLVALAAAPALAAKSQKPPRAGEDDWQFEAEFAKVHKTDPTGYARGAGGPPRGPAPMVGRTMRAMGLAVGGAKDGVTFRDNIAKGYMPQESAVSYEGLFYDYAFDTGGKCEGKAVFCPTALTRVAPDPFTKAPQSFLAVGLASGLTPADVPRRPLRLMLVLDVSGSMSAPFDAYYYDTAPHLRSQDAPLPDRSMPKLRAAGEAVIALLDQLTPEDRFGLVLFDNFAYTALPLRRVAERDMEAIKGHIRGLTPLGGTNLEAALHLGTALVAPTDHAVPAGAETRLIVMTDAMPNLGRTSDTAFFKGIKSNAGRDIFTTIIGIGLDFNTELTERITKVRGANFYAVHSPQAFRERLGSEFLGMVTPVAFDLALRLTSPGFAIDAVYGSPEADAATGELVRVSTLFPAPATEEGSRGGIILLRLRPTGPPAPITLTASYEDRGGGRHTSRQTVDFAPNGQAWGEATVRKAILLARYAGLLRQWIGEHRGADDASEAPLPADPIQTSPGHLRPAQGRPVPQRHPGRWEQRSMPLTVTKEDKARFKTFLAAFDRELPACNDPSLSRERVVLETLIHYEPGLPVAQPPRPR